MNPAPLQPGFAHFLAQADSTALFVLALLLAMSLACWYVILARLMWGRARRRRSRVFLESFRAAPARYVDGVDHEGMGQFAPGEPYGRIAQAAFRTWGRITRHEAHAGPELGTAAERMASTLRRALNEEAARLERGLSVLASVASSAPFVGLFGTVWGIYHALLAIGASGRAGLDQVAGPVGEALVMTAFGLSVAIPAVLAYNAFQRGNRVLLAELDGYAHDLHDYLADGGEGR